MGDGDDNYLDDSENHLDDSDTHLDDSENPNHLRVPAQKVDYMRRNPVFGGLLDWTISATRCCLLIKIASLPPDALTGPSVIQGPLHLSAADFSWADRLVCLYGRLRECLDCRLLSVKKREG